MSDKLQQCHLIGAGRAGSALAQAMTKVGYQFTWVGSRNAESAEKLAKLIGTEEWWTDFRDIQEVDGFLIIAIPDDKIKMVAATIRDAGVIKPGRTV
ncbi:MAG: NAD(P)-binding domain-containing protein, partial [Candidatus Latescibacteria bacterium]|nr:NAD(P)-binding domain-containing protein [Candidatus Latescibacterota bacterium]